MSAQPAPGGSVWADHALALAARLLALATTGEDGTPAWAGDDLDPAGLAVGDEHPGVVTLRLDDGLLTGRAGIALALAACSRLPGPGGGAGGGPADPRLAAVARGAAAASVDAAAAGLPAGPLGWDRGALGIARAASVVALLTADDVLAERARDLALDAVGAVVGGADLPPWPDLLGGVAGVLAGVCAVDLPPGADDLRRQAVRLLVRRLEEQAVEDPAGARWPMAGLGVPVAGLAHGASGVALALRAGARALEAAPSRMRAVAADDVLHAVGCSRALADDGVRWEEGLSEPATGGWPDLRVDPPAPGLAWCHGAPGIGVCAALVAAAEPGGRVAAHAHATYLRSVAAARWHRPAAADFDGTLCHGLAGVIEQHLVAADAWPAAAAEHLRLARAVARHLVEAGEPGRPRWHCGVPGGRTPNLLVGIAGVALTLARCHDPHVAPSGADPLLGGAVTPRRRRPG